VIGRLDRDQCEVEVAEELIGGGDRVERDAVLDAGLHEGQARIAQARDVLLVGVEHDDAPDLGRELGGGDPTDGSAADDEHAGVDHRRGRL
jgi:hypothetical protein